MLFPVFVLRITACKLSILSKSNSVLQLMGAYLGLAIPLAYYKGALYGCQIPKGQGTVTSLM